MPLDFLHYDVFTDEPLTGNQLAVFLDGRGLSTERRQAIAREMNFSESTFILPPETAGTDVRLRIFTPAREIPMAGHPTIGSTCALAHAGVIRPGAARFVFGLGIGPTPVDLEWNEDRLRFVWMTQLPPTFGPSLDARDLAATAVGLDVSDLATELPVQEVSCGLPWRRDRRREGGRQGGARRPRRTAGIKVPESLTRREADMKVRVVAGVIVAGVIALGSAALAQTVPAQFVVSGKAAEQIQDFATINLATAERIAEACQRLAAAEGVAITMMVIDNDGNHVYSDRMDGQGYLNIITADMKAQTALMQRAPSKFVMNQVTQNPNAELQRIQLGLFPNSGGLPVVVNKQMIGAIGIGGSAPRVPVWSDEICGHKALQEVLGASNVAPLIEDLPRPQPPAPANPAPVPRFATAATPRTNVSNPEWVVGGKGAANVFDGNQISLAAARRVARVCRDFAASRGGGMSLYIIDNAGEIVHMERMDGQVFNNIRTALMKAQTSLKSRVPTSVYTAQGRNNPAGQTRTIAQFEFFTNSGGLPIVVDGQMIGAIGVGGGAGGGGDENCAIEGLKAVFGEHVTLPVYPTASAASGGR